MDASPTSMPKAKIYTRKDMQEPVNQVREGNNEDHQPDIQGSRFNTLANLMEENLSLRDMVSAKIPIMEAGNIRVNKKGSCSVARNYKHFNQGKSIIPDRRFTKASK